jgi:hypothetical protein
MAEQLIFVSLIVILGLSYFDFWLLVFIFPVLLWYPITQIVLIRWGKRFANEYFLRDWKGMAQIGEYSIARGHLFLRVPNITEDYVKPTSVSRIGDSTFTVRSKWLKRFQINFENKADGDIFFNQVMSLIQ